MNRSEMKKKAVLLRSNGGTFREISRKMLIPLSTVFLWTKDVILSDEQLELIKLRHQEVFVQGRQRAARRQKELTQSKELMLKSEGSKLIGEISKREMLLVGAALYWAEGFKKDSRLGFANSDPAMIRLFLKWLVRIGGAEREQIRLRVGMNIGYKDRVQIIERKWSKITGIGLEQFQKPFFQKVKLKKKYDNEENYLGVLRVRANGQTELFLKIKGMVEGLKRCGVSVFTRLELGSQGFGGVLTRLKVVLYCTSMLIQIKRLDRKERQFYEEFVGQLGSLKAKDKLGDFLVGILTPAELTQIVKRLQIIKKLKKGVPQRQIAEELGVGIATVTRGARELGKGRFECIK